MAMNILDYNIIKYNHVLISNYGIISVLQYITVHGVYNNKNYNLFIYLFIYF